MICKCGCGQATKVRRRSDPRRGTLAGEYADFAVGHNKRAPGPRWLDEDRGHETPCRIWQLRTDRRGYGRVTVASRRGLLAHKVEWEKSHGPVPAGLELDHLCRVPACVNPEHLEPVTGAVNVRRGATAKLDEAKVVGIRERAGRGADLQLIADEHGVTYQCIWDVVRGRVWKGVA